MLTSETKRHIDAARQVLVGVVPNPSSQIDQITNALIYKFMDDMDQAAIKAGGEPSFFVDDLERYAWTRLMDARIGDQERMNLYSEALIKLSEAKQLPELFRGIFKSAFLPYRSPETLGLFLKEIDYFDYSHSEELGNAYEYLLSIMSSQGEAGQFRTPRHIIDFIVDVVNPTKDDKVLDPACGTGGFLVSSYKHILEQHDGKDDPEKKEKSLTPDQRRNLMSNFEGYDIDPTMARIAQVNMYLHQFKNPKIYNYDTLSSDERWNDRFDVILANPPFMTPRGGMRPHSKFSVQSSRSEVLFADYIMNHLRPKGRAGIIVPEGIIFQSGTAYKQLRQNLVNDGLYAVVSLPAGVFNPYSGVKTSILFFDNEVAKLTKDLLFVKITNDGFDLGAQRKPLKHSHLPAAIEILKLYKQHVIEGKKIVLESDDQFALFVPKEKIAENGNYNLSGDHYRVVADYANAKWPMVELGDVAEVLNGYAFKSEKYTDKGIRVIRITNVQKGLIVDDDPKFYPIELSKEIEKFLLAKNDLLISLTGNVGRVGLLQSDLLPAGLNQRVGCIRLIGDKRILISYLFHILNTDFFEKDCIRSASGIAQKNLSTEWLKKYRIPLPPLEIQEWVVEQIDGYQKIIDGIQQAVSNWKPRIEIDPEWEKVKLGEVLEFVGSGATPLGGQEVYQNEGVLFIRSQNVLWGETDFSDAVFISDEINNSMKRSQVKKDDVLFNITGASIGRCAIFNETFKANVNQHVAILRCGEKILPQFLMVNILGKDFQNEIWAMQGGASRQSVNYQQIKKFQVPLPPLEIQKQIVEKIEFERSGIEKAKELLPVFKQHIKNTIVKLWEE